VFQVAFAQEAIRVHVERPARDASDDEHHRCASACSASAGLSHDRTGSPQGIAK